MCLKPNIKLAKLLLLEIVLMTENLFLSSELLSSQKISHESSQWLGQSSSTLLLTTNHNLPPDHLILALGSLWRRNLQKGLRSPADRLIKSELLLLLILRSFIFLSWRRSLNIQDGLLSFQWIILSDDYDRVDFSHRLNPNNFSHDD